MTDAEYEKAYRALASDVATTVEMEHAIAGRAPPKQQRTRGRALGGSGGKRAGKHAAAAAAPSTVAHNPKDVARKVLAACVEERRRTSTGTQPDLSDEALSQYARFTDKFAFKPYERFLWYVPRLVNVVTVRRNSVTRPVARSDSGAHRSSPRPSPSRARASRCRSTCTTSPRAAATRTTRPRSSAPCSWPTRARAAGCWCFTRGDSLEQARSLVEHLVHLLAHGLAWKHTSPARGTGTSGPMAARLALMRAQRQLYEDAGVHIHVNKFAVINQVGAASLNATLNCEEFASAHSSTAHFDIKSFVGLAWRPAGESICCGALQTATIVPLRTSSYLPIGAQRCTQLDARTYPGASSSGSCTSPFRACCPSCCASARRRGCSS